MRRVAWVWAALGVALVFASPAAARTQTYFGFQIGITNAPPPRVVFYDEPVVYAVPGYSVYAVEDCPYDMFRYGRSWYVCDDGYWYRGYGYRGPFRAIDVRYVPRHVLHANVWYRDHPRYRSHRGYRSRDYGYRSRDGGYRDRGDWAYRNRDWRDRDRRDRYWNGRGRDYRGWSRDGRLADARDWNDRDRRGDWRSRDRDDNRRDYGRGDRGKGKHKRGHGDRDDD